MRLVDPVADRPNYRLFVSSPGDVEEERARAGRVIERLATEFAEQLMLTPVLWERRTYSALTDFQSQIAATADCHLIIGILWSRIGSPLPPDLYCRPGGQPYESGTVFEIETALEQGRDSGVPDVAVFEKRASVAVDPRAPQADLQQQLTLLHGVLQRWQWTEGGHFKAAFNSFQTPDEFETKLEQHLREWLAKHGHQPHAPRWDVERLGSPYPRLEPYDAARRPVFFGRSAARLRCLELLRQATARDCAFLLVLGASGSGKSSLARAGVLPDLALPGTLPGVDAWRTATLRPGHDPLSALAAALFAALPELADGDAPELKQWAAAVAAHAAFAAGSIAAALRRAGTVPKSPQRLRLALLVDQLEEAFEASGQPGIFAALDALARSGHVSLIATLRSDRYASVQAEPLLLRLKQDGAQYDLPPAGLAEFDEIVRGSAKAAGLSYERRADKPGDLGDVIEAALGIANALPLLQMALAELFDARDRATGMLTFAAYGAMGGLEGAIERRAETVFGAADAKAQATLPVLLLDLAGGVSANGEVVGRPVATKRLDQTLAAARLRRALVDGRLLLADGDTARVAHDALLRFWPRAKTLLDPARIRAKARLEDLMIDWRDAREARRYLLRSGPLLETGADLRRHYGPALSPDLTTFIAASLQADRRRRWRLGTVAAFLVLLFGALGTASLFASQEAERNFGVAEQAIYALVFDLVQGLRDRQGMPAEVIGELLARVEQTVGRIEASVPGNPRILRLSAAASVEIATTLMARGDLVHARQAAEDAMRRMERLVTTNPGNVQWQHDLSASHIKLGEVLEAQGDLPGALAAFRASMAIDKRQAAADPGNAGWQYHLSVSHNQVGQVLEAQGDLPGALAAFRASIAIRERLTAADPGNAKWQREMSASYTMLGGVLLTQGDQPGALAAFRASMAINERQAAADPGNAGWQRDLSISRDRFGDVLLAQGDLPGALAAFRASMAIRERLTAADPGNADWQRILSISHNKFGDVLLAQGDLPGALAALRASMAIRERLTAADPGNTRWQRDLAVSHLKLGDVLVEQGDQPGALAAYRASMAINERLTAIDPSNVDWQLDLINNLCKATMILVDRNDGTAVVAVQRTSALAVDWVKRFPQDPRRDVVLKKVEELVSRSGAR